MLARVGFGAQVQKKTDDTFAVDVDGTIRLIERDAHSKDPLLEEPEFSKNFEWVCKSLCKTDPTYVEETNFKLIDTVFLENGCLSSWYFTSRTGHILKKSSQNTTWDHINDSFTGFHERYSHPASAVATLLNGNSEVYLEKNYMRWTAGLAPINVNKLSPFLLSKGTSNCNFRHEFGLAIDGKPLHSNYKLWNQQGAKDVIEKSSFIKSMEVTVNLGMEHAVTNIVHIIEHNKKVKVIKLEADFCLDEFGDLYLVNTTRCDVISGKNLAVRPKSKNGNANEVETSDVYFGGNSFDFEEQQVKQKSTSPTKRLKTSIPSSKERAYSGYIGPTNMAERFGFEKGRNWRERTHAEKEILNEERLDSKYIVKPQSYKNPTEITTEIPNAPRGLSPVKRKRKDSLDSYHSLDSYGEITRTAKSAALGSSQQVGCPGDFCDYEMFVAADTDILGNMKNILTKQEMSHILNKMDGNSDNNKTYKLSYHQLMQARAEKKLVDLMIRRHESGIEGDYILDQSSNNFSGSGYQAITKGYSSHYYKDVYVCSNCYKMYNKIENSRNKALKKIERKNDERSLSPERSSNNNNSNNNNNNEVHENNTNNAEKDTSAATDENDNDFDSPEKQFLKEAQVAIEGLTKADVSELRVYSNPPPAVVLVTSAVMLLITGEALPWAASKRIMANGERFINMLLSVDEDNIAPSKLAALKKYTCQIDFHPDVVAGKSLAASKFAAFVLGVVHYASHKACNFHERLNVSNDQKLDDNSEIPSNNASTFPEMQTGKVVGVIPTVQPVSKGKERSLSPTYVSFGRGESGSLSPKANGKRKHNGNITISGMDEEGALNWSRGRPREREIKVKSKLTKKEREARRMIQAQQMQRLFSGSEENANAGDEEEQEENIQNLVKNKTFKAIDGTKVPYEVIGKADVELKKTCFIVTGDFFDTLESMQIFFRPVIQANYGCQILVWNIPGQAFTATQESTVLNNEYSAGILHQLLQKLQDSAEFISFGRPFTLLGFGNGANIATYFALRYGEQQEYAQWLRSLISFNGFAHVDNQLAAILHSSVNVFTSFPNTRPDLPVSYFCRFLFSDGYLSKVDPNLVLNIYTAVSNPITLDGRIRICRGALNHVDLRCDLAKLHVPIILVQATEDLLVNPTHVDAFLEGRSVSHIWSHQAGNKNVLAGGGANQLRNASKRTDAALVVWLRTGHEVKQEAKKQILDMINVLATADEVPEGPPPSLSTAAATKKAFSGTTSTRPSFPTPIESRQMFGASFNAPGFSKSSKDEINDQDQKKEINLSSNSNDKNIIDGGDKSNDLDESNKKEEDQQVNARGETLIRGVDPVEYVLASNSSKSQVNALLVANELERKKELSAAETDFEEVMKNHRKNKMIEEQNRKAQLEKLGVVTINIDKKPHSKNVKVETPSSSSPNNISPISNNENDVSDKKKAKSPSSKSSSRSNSPSNLKHKSTSTPKNFKSNDIAPSTSANDIIINRAFNSIGVFAEDNNNDPAQDDEEDENNTPDIDETNLPQYDEIKYNYDSSNKKTAAKYENNKSTVPIFVEKESNEANDENNWTASGNPENLFDDFQKEQERLRKEEQKLIADRLNSLKVSQDARRLKWEEEDHLQLKQIEMEMAQRRAARAKVEEKRTRQIYEMQMKIASEKAIEAEKEALEKRAALAKQRAGETIDEISDILKGSFGPESPRLPTNAELERKDRLEVRIASEMKDDRITDISAMFNEMKHLEKATAPMKGGLRMEEYEVVRKELERAEELFIAKMTDSELNRYLLVRNKNALNIQRCYRGHLGRNKSKEKRKGLEKEALRKAASIRIQSLIRGFLARARVRSIKEKMTRDRVQLLAAKLIQKVYRGHKKRQELLKQKKIRSAVEIQRVARGRQGRLKARRERERRARIALEIKSATVIQSGWRMKQGREIFQIRKKQDIAARNIQRVFRGHRGRIRADRIRQWASAEPGPERLQLGLRMIKESQDSFERQKQEINALHRAQQKAEVLVSEINAGLKESEKELHVLESELKGIDDLDKEIHELTHENEMVKRSVDSVKASTEAKRQGGTLTPGDELAAIREERARAQESYELEMAIHVKRAERERKKKELETEFAGVFKEVGNKKDSLNKLELRLQDMESTRQRKDREFQRIQRNLMELLGEQKQELDNLRQKGVELETATATSAAAAAATAASAKEQEQRSGAIFDSTQELLKFQFMSMSMSYFSSLNMLKNLRDMNADTTTAAITSSSQTAAAAAAAAAAANIPSLKHLKLGAHDLVNATNARRRDIEVNEAKSKEEAEKIANQPFPIDVKLWKVADVTRWLTSLSLGQYTKAFAEGSIDGEFLLELRAEDMREVLGVEHELHVKKICLYRDKLRPLTEEEKRKKKDVITDENATSNRAAMENAKLAMTTEEVFVACRNGRIKKIQQYLDNGFAPDTEDSKGNTLLLVASQQVHKQIVELMISRGSNVNHKNLKGNTALHYAMAYDPDGALGEFLISRGANDMIENKSGMSPYDGLGDGDE